MNSHFSLGFKERKELQQTHEIFKDFRTYLVHSHNGKQHNSIKRCMHFNDQFKSNADVVDFSTSNMIHKKTDEFY